MTSRPVRSIGLPSIEWPLVAGGLVALAILVGAPASPSGGGPTAAPSPTNELLTTAGEVVPAVVAQAPRLDWRPVDRSPRGGFPFVLAATYALCSLATTDLRRLASGPSGTTKVRAARSWRRRAPPARFFPVS